MITLILAKFKVVEVNSSSWSSTLLDEITDELWESFYVQSKNHGGGYHILAKLPLPPTEEIIHIILCTKYEDEIFAGCKILLDNEEQKMEGFRLDLINQLEKIKERWRQQKIIMLTDLTSSLNKSEVLDKSYNEVKTAADQYKEIALRASKLL